MSTLLQEIYQTLHITWIQTTPYHPQTDGLVVRFNGTLKSMLRMLTSSNQKDWDEVLPYLLFTYREVAQESTSFSPFELLYGHRVRGPLDVLDVLKEVWSEAERENTTVASHVITMKKHLQGMTGIVKTNLTKAQKRQKLHYDERVKPQTLQRCWCWYLPNVISCNWNGRDHTKSQDRLPVDYEVETPGRHKEKKIYHIIL